MPAKAFSELYPEKDMLLSTDWFELCALGLFTNYMSQTLKHRFIYTDRSFSMHNIGLREVLCKERMLMFFLP